jgi:AraC family transcriptional regulator
VPNAAARLQAWAEAHGCAQGQWLGYQWDNPELSSLARAQYFVAVEAPGAIASGEVGCVDFPPMRVAEVEVRGDLWLEISALRFLYGSWLPHSGCEPDDHPCFEAWFGRPFAHGLEHFELRVQLPVVRGGGRTRASRSHHRRLS